MPHFPHQNNPIIPGKEEVSLAREASRKLAPYAQSNDRISLIVRGKEGQAAEIEVSPAVVRMLLDILEQTANGNAVHLSPLYAELSTQQAAEILNVSRPHLIKLLEQGDIPFYKVGSHRRLLAQDVLAYREQRYKERQRAMSALTAESQALEWGYD